MNGLASPREDDDRKPAAATDERQILYDGYANLPVNHLAVIKVRAWSPSSPHAPHVFTCTANISHDDGMLHSNKRKNRKSGLSYISEEEDEEDDDDDDDDSNINEEGYERRDSLVHGPSYLKGSAQGDDIHAGSLVGMHRSHNHNNDDRTWNVDDTFRIRNKVHFMAHTEIPHLIRLLRHDDNRLQTLVLDGLPPSAFTSQTIQEFATALGEVNTSVHTLSMDYSNINDELGHALASSLVSNTTLKHLSLVGNSLSGHAAKHFFNLIHGGGGRRGSSIGSIGSGHHRNNGGSGNNETLQSLDLRDNPNMDSDIFDAVNQFMEQREFKRKMSSMRNKHTGGGDPDNNNDDDDDRDTIRYDNVTAVCHESILEGNYDPKAAQLEEASVAGNAPEMEADLSPLPDESFMHYVNRVKPRPMKKMKSVAKIVMAHQRLYAAVAQDNNDVGSKLDSSSISSHPNHVENSRGVVFDDGPLTREEEDARLKSDRRGSVHDGQVGITHVNEAAPGRQTRRTRASRTKMTESQRRLRLTALTSSGAGSSAGLDENAEDSNDRAFSRMRTQESDYYYDNESLEGNKSKGVFGLDDPEIRMDFCLCGCMCCLFMVVIVMVVVYFTAF